VSSPPSLPTLSIQHLTVEFATRERVVTAVRDVSFDVGHGETVAVVGESGSGKSVTALSVMRLVEHGGGRITSGRIEFARPDSERVDLAGLTSDAMRTIRGAEIAMIFQEPMTSLNPVFTVGEQIAESIRLHQGKDLGAARAEALRMLEVVRIPEARAALRRYPHQLSGGMRQRVMIAMALSCRPRLLIADEPTTALDVMVQAQILELLVGLAKDLGLALVLVTHDLPVIAQVCQRAAVMYAGEIVEAGPIDDLFHDPRHPYTRLLFAATPDLYGEEDVVSIPGVPPRLDREIVGCPFRPRCDKAFDRCVTEHPALIPLGPGRAAACHLNDDDRAFAGDAAASGEPVL